MNKLYSFTSKRLKFRLLAEDDIQYLETLEIDPIVKKFFPDGGRNKKETELMIQRFINNFQTSGLPCFLIFDKVSNEFIGRCGFGPVEPDEIEVGYVLHQKDWGKGYATEALRAMLIWAKENIPRPYIIAYADIENTASLRVMEKCGMHYYKHDIAKGKKCKFYKINLQSIQG